MKMDFSHLVKWEYLSNAILAYLFSLLLVLGLDVSGIYLSLMLGLLSPLLTPLLIIAFTLILSTFYFKFTKQDSLGAALSVLFVLFCIEVVTLQIGKAVEFQFSQWFFATRLITIILQSAIAYFALSLLLPKDEKAAGEKPKHNAHAEKKHAPAAHVHAGEKKQTQK